MLYSLVNNLIFVSLRAALIWSKKKGTIISIIIPQQFFLCLVSQIISLITENVSVILTP